MLINDNIDDPYSINLHNNEDEEDNASFWHKTRSDKDGSISEGISKKLR
jgi:hypothetical protein